MKPILQTPGDKQCLRVCVASLFGLPLDEVPFFGGRLAFTPGKEGEREIETHAELRAWLKARGLGYVYIRNAEKEPIPIEPWGLCIAFGPTQRKTYHAVVWDVGWHLGDRHADRPAGWGRMVHDPHPDGTGLLQVDGWYCFTVRDPAALPNPGGSP